MSKPDSGLKTFFVGLWRVIDGARKVFLNLLFLLLLFIVLLVFLAPGSQPVRLQNDTTLVLRPFGQVVEEFTTTPLDRALQQASDQPPMETRLRDLLDAVRKASTDPRITQMVIDTDYLTGIGMPALLELEGAVERFKETGKGVIGSGDYMTQHGYYLASMADEVWLHPEGMVFIDGYSRVRHYYREGLEKLAVEINLFRAGEFKSAMEPYIRDDMSPEAREANLHWLGNLWNQYIEGVSRHRGIPEESLAPMLADLPTAARAWDGDLAEWALRSGLVDRLVTRPVARQELALRGAPDAQGDGFRRIGHQDYLAMMRPPIPAPGAPDVMVVVAAGDITSGDPGPGRIGADALSHQLRDVGRRDGVRAVVLRLDSPGGEVLASEQIRNELQLLRDSGKTVVISMGELAASGGYWIATAADEIWASPATLTGSIGVFAMIPTFGGTLEKIGVRADGVGTTPMAGKLRIDQPLDEGVGQIFQASVQNTYRKFLERVAEARGMTVEEVDAIAGGRVWSGAQAARHGLVDRLGTTAEAVDAAARMAGLGEDYRVEWYQQELTPFEAFVEEFTLGAVTLVAGAAGPVSALRADWAPLTLANRVYEDMRYLASSGERITLAAHCLCRIR
ncbi:signal peptide peptidase SppA [Marinihelvus fidelis]|uniref:Signal peptide peptidase SppA n=1 Tax=Marinihelvus fidelis TaxID=2613842 RepID=A0A5N0T8Y2_9GAMM|nr:signal peptide peptidase SppA [Marinihelvus fidelis]KAA9130934.1 signal peptide peptidase SppA [Marinihelvus fidelis]